ncbi:hypothetical protein LRX75_21075 [Rhizobium sp. DKSPLA3]|uniref:Uncharacterized protein n=1 Tax=Rhizobium quercicola TaxID=2901226 RepID=A0A9X1NW22_9HYPH|nr:hypothetical protein [Rhizobium quercicola]MCD7111533.1 hypothetical protein [Rhizobium quercicola]
MGLSATGRSLKNPATARKAEKKKRGERARAITNDGASAGKLLDDLGAVLRHDGLYSRSTEKGQGRMKKKALAHVQGIV